MEMQLKLNEKEAALKTLHEEMERLKEKLRESGGRASTLALGSAGNVPGSSLQEERDYLLKSLGEFESKLIGLEEYSEELRVANMSLEAELAEVTKDKMQAIEMAEMLLLQKLNESDGALLVNSRQKSIIPHSPYSL